MHKLEYLLTTSSTLPVNIVLIGNQTDSGAVAIMPSGRLAARIGSGSAGFLSCQLAGSLSMGGCRRRAVLPGLLRTGVAAGVSSAACAAAQAPAYGDSMTFGVSGRDGLALEFYVGVT